MTQSLFPVEIFPEGLTYSLLTPVLLGVLIMAFATETLGGGFSGLVVPGYLAPIFLLKPWSGFVITAEALVTYLIVRALSDVGCRLGLWSVFFGRDRFLALVVMGTIVRVLSEGFLLPAVVMGLGEALPAGFDFRGNLHSVGLISVPLLANMFWKTGVLDGIPGVLLPVGATYLGLRFALMPLTNFSVGRMELTYDSLAIDVLANPKSYILLMTAMVMASRAALRYGWDFNGIMVPGLMALTWFEPAKMLATCVEAYLIYRITGRMLTLSIFENVTIEGPRKIVSGFLVGYALKYLACRVAVGFLPGYNPIDLFGFGYMLPTLMAVKMIQKGNAAVVLGPTLVVSGLGALVGSATGFLLMLAVPATAWLPDVPVAGRRGPLQSAAEAPRGDVAIRLEFDRRLILAGDWVNSYERPYPAEEGAFSAAMAALQSVLRGRRTWPEVEDEVREMLGRVGMSADVISETGPPPRRFVHIAEAVAPGRRPRGHGLFVLRLPNEGARPLVVQVPHPVSETGTLESGAWLLDALDASALFVAGAHRDTNTDGSADVIGYARTLFQAAHRTFRDWDAVSIRSARPGEDAALEVLTELPAALDVTALRDAAGEMPMTWPGRRERHCQAGTAQRGFASIRLTPAAIRRLRERRFGSAPLPVVVGPVEKLVPEPQQPGTAGAPSAGAPSAGASGPSTSWRQFFDHSLFAPLAELTHSPAGAPVLPAQLRQLDAVAGQLGFELSWWQEAGDVDRKVLLLREKQPAARRRGLFFFRVAGAAPLVFEVPEPDRELRTAALGSSLFQSERGRALLVGAGSEPSAVDDAASLFHLAHQALARRPLAVSELTVQVRGFARDRHPGVVASMVLTPVSMTREGLGPVRKLKRRLERTGETVAFQDYSRALVPFSTLSTPQERYNSEFGAGPFVYLHVSDWTRRDYAAPALEADEEEWRFRFLDDLGIRRRHGSLLDRLRKRMRSGRATTGVQEEILELMIEYGETRDPHLIAEAAARARDERGSLELLHDDASGLSFLLAELPGARLVVNPGSRRSRVLGPVAPGKQAASARRLILQRERALRVQAP